MTRFPHIYNGESNYSTCFMSHFKNSELNYIKYLRSTQHARFAGAVVVINIRKCVIPSLAQTTSGKS